MRESGSLIPQLLIGAWVRRHAQRPRFWVLGSVMQGLCMLGMAGAVRRLDGTVAGLVVIGMLVVLVLARGLCSVAMKDVQGKCIPKARRGRLSELASTVAGLVVVVLGVTLFGQNSQPSREFYAVLLISAVFGWFLAAAVFSRAEGYEEETAGGRNVFEELAKSANLRVVDKPFRGFVITRELLMCSALSAPFFVLLVQRHDADGRMLGAFLIASSLAASVSSAV